MSRQSSIEPKSRPASAPILIDDDTVGASLFKLLEPDASMTDIQGTDPLSLPVVDPWLVYPKAATPLM